MTLRKIIVIIIIPLLCCLFSTSIYASEDCKFVTDEFIEFINESNKFTSSIKIERGFSDVTSYKKDQYIKLAKDKKYNELFNYLQNENLDVSFIDSGDNNSNNSRAFKVKTYKKRFSHSKTLTYYNREVKANWTTIVSCEFSYNENTYKIGNVYETTVTLENHYISNDLEYAELTNVYTPLASKSSDGLSLNFKASYRIKAKAKNYKWEVLDLESYTDIGVAKA